MRHKALEVQKAQTLERIEKKLDLLAKALKVDFSAFSDQSSAVSELEEAAGDQPSVVSEPEAKPRKSKSN